MGKYFDFLGENDEEYQVRFEILEEKEGIHRYGIRAILFCRNVRVDSAEVPNRFLTRNEAEETIQMLCRFQVTPCTLCDIV